MSLSEEIINEGPLFITKRLRQASFVSFAAVAFTTQPVNAGGFLLEHQNAIAMGRAFAGAEAVFEDVAFIAYNPASLAGARGQGSITVTGIILDSGYQNANGQLSGINPIDGRSSGDTALADGIVPNLTIGGRLINDLSIGLVVNTPFGLRSNYANDSIFRYQAQESDLITIEATPTLAYQVTDSVSIGAGLRIQYLDLGLSSIIDAGGAASAFGINGFGPQTSDASAVFDGDNVDIGYTVGVLFKFTEQIDVGIAYDSAIDHSIEGAVAFDLSASAAGQLLNSTFGLLGATDFTTDFALPASLAIGATIDLGRPSLFFSAKRTFWSVFDVVELELDGITPNEVLTQNWTNSWQVSAGAEYIVADGLTGRLGVMWDQSPVNAGFASPRIPDSDRVWLSAGVSREFNDRAAFDLGVAYAFFEDREFALDGSLPENLFRGSASGQLETSAVAISGTFRYKF
ncbi:MAG: OmpP1/FadL family transporter [Pseudomonadota bacterium]